MRSGNRTGEYGMRNDLAGECAVHARRSAIAGCVMLLLAIGCTDRPEAPAPTSPDSTSSANSSRPEWAIDTVDAPRFRAHGWARDTLWGIARGRLAFFADTSLTILADTVWGVWTAPGNDMVAWTSERGVFIRTSAGTMRLLGRDDAPPQGEFGPGMSWGSATRAFLTWTSEGAPPLSVIAGTPDNLTHRVLTARASPDQFVTQPALWLDDRHVLTAVVAHRARNGASMPSEGGRRAN